MSVEIRNCIAKLKSISPYSQSGFFQSSKKDKESSADFEKRCWRERLHADSEGIVFIPAMALKYAIDEAQKRLGTQVPGEGKTRWTKYIESGLMIASNPSLGIHKDDVQPEWIWASSTGSRAKGGGTRVQRCYPTIPEWKATVEITVLNPKIKKEVVETALSEAGLFVGIGRFRPENQGYYGRFTVVSTKWS